MAGIPKAIEPQTDFSAGEIDVSAKRSDSPAAKAGARQMSNFRILNTKGVTNRPGRRIVQLLSAINNVSRTEEVTLSPGHVFRLVFSQTRLDVFDSTGATVFTLTDSSRLIWQSANLNQIVYAVLGKTIYLTFAPPGTIGMVPQALAWDGISVWTIANYTTLNTSGNQTRTIFYRLSKLGIAMLPTAATGNITMQFSSPVPGFSAAMIGSLLRYCGRQILVTGFTNAQSLTGTVKESLPPAQIITTVSDPRNIFNLGDVVVGALSGAKGIVVLTSAINISVQLTSVTQNSATVTTGFISNEVIASQGGSIRITNTGSDVTNASPASVAVWDDEVFNSFRGWPASCFADQGRLGFCNFPALPNGISWSAISSPNDLYVDVNPSSAMFELTPDKTQVRYVVAGPESSEFVFCDTRIYYIPISPTNPLKPGSVAFQLLSGDGAAPVQPRAVQEVIIYINAGQSSVMSVLAPGAYYRPYETRSLTDMHFHLINNPVAIAAPASDDAHFNERYIYVLNGDGTIAVGKYSVDSGQIKGVVGWVPWTGAGTVQWVASLGSDVIFSTVYPGDAVVELLDNTLYLDGAEFVNALPTALLPPAGKGPLFWTPNGAVSLMDQGNRSMGIYQVDANGFIVPQNVAGENLASLTLVAGQAWNAALEPFVPPAQGGADQKQRLYARRISRAQIYVKDSTGFRLDSLRSGQQGPNLPAPGTVTRSRRVTTYNQNDDPTKPPLLREQDYLFRPIGRSPDPRIAIVKDSPGPLTIIEIGLEVSV
jgi:hypothetical protein